MALARERMCAWLAKSLVRGASPLLAYVRSRECLYASGVVMRPCVCARASAELVPQYD